MKVIAKINKHGQVESSLIYPYHTDKQTIEAKFVLEAGEKVHEFEITEAELAKLKEGDYHANLHAHIKK